jgi:hypothetical protein
MYAASANNCGDSNFNKRAVFWLAADEAEKAGRLDGRLKDSSCTNLQKVTELVHHKKLIFLLRVIQGQTINIGCWIGRTITVPSL